MTSIADILLQSGRDVAAGARAQGEIRANEFANIGQIIGAIPQQIAQQRRQQTIDSMNNLKLSEAQRDVSGQRAVASMMAGDQLPAGASGPRQESFLDDNGLFDIKKITGALGAAGYGDKASELVSGAEKINDSILKHQQLEQQMGSAQALMFGDMADGALKLAKSGTPIPDAMDFVVQPALATKRIDPKAYAQLRDHMAQLPPDQQAAALTTLMDQAAKLDKGETLPEGAQHVDRYGRTTVSGATKAPTETELALKAARVGTPAEQPGDKEASTAMDRLKPAPPANAAADDQKYEAIKVKMSLNPALVTKEERAFVDAYNDRRTVTTDAAATAAANRQAAAQTQANDLQKRAQDFQVSKEARAELAGKVESPYLTARTSADTLRDVVDAAANGNKIAASLQSLEETMGAIRSQGLNRINGVEIGTTANAGSLFDRIDGWIGKATKGQPVPANIQKDMKEFADILDKAAYKKYSDQFDSIAKFYGLNDQQKSLKMPPPDSVKPLKGERRLINGKLGEWDGTGWAPVIAK